MSQCKSCKAEIKWIKTPAGKNHPVDAKPVQVWIKNENDLYPGDSFKPVTGYASHFATCPQASQHRRNG